MEHRFGPSILTILIVRRVSLVVNHWHIDNLLRQDRNLNVVLMLNGHQNVDVVIGV